MTTISNPEDISSSQDIAAIVLQTMRNYANVAEVQESGCAVAGVTKYKGPDAFRDCTSLESINIPQGVTSIGEGAFSRCTSLRSITLHKGVRLIGQSAFKGCSSLTSIDIPQGVESIGSYAFIGCSSLTSFALPQSVTKIEFQSFTGCASLRSITLYEGVTSIGFGAFSGCSSLTSITLPKDVRSIAGNAFHGCDLLEQRYPNGTNYDHNTHIWLQQRFADMPIHQACYRQDITANILSNLIQANNDTTLALTDAMGMTALHVLCCNPNATADAIKVLKYSYTVATSARNVAGMTPLMMLLKCKGLAYEDLFVDGEIVPLVRLLELGVECDVLEIMINFESRLVLDLKNRDEVSNLLPFMQAAVLPSYTLGELYVLAIKHPHLLQRERVKDHNNKIRPFSISNSVPIFFLHGDLHLHEQDVVIENGVGPPNATVGFQRYAQLIENHFIRVGYNASRNKEQYITDKVIDPLLNEGRHFYFYVKDENLYELIDVTKPEVKLGFSKRVAVKIRNGKNIRSHRRTQHGEENTPKAKQSSRLDGRPSLPNPSTTGNAQHEIRTISSSPPEVNPKGSKAIGDSTSHRSLVDSKVDVGVSKNSGLLLHRFGNDPSNRQVIGRGAGDNGTIPISFKPSDLPSHDHDVVIQNGWNILLSASTEGFKRYTKLIEEPYIRNGYNASKNKKQFVIDKVIDPLLKEGRIFYIKKGDIYELLNLTDAEIKWGFTERVTQKIRDCNKRLNRSSQREEENPPHLNKISISQLDSQTRKHTINSALGENPTVNFSVRRNQANSEIDGDASRNADILLSLSRMKQNNQSNKQVNEKVVDVNNKINLIGSHPDSKTVPIAFRANTLHLHEDDVVIQNGGKRSRILISTQGFKKYTEITGRLSIRDGYDASKSKKQFVIDKVINPLLNEGRHFYIKKGDLYELIDLTDADIVWKFAEKVAQKIRDCKNKRLQGSYQHEEKSVSNSHLVGGPLPTQALNTAGNAQHDVRKNLNDQSNKQAVGKVEEPQSFSSLQSNSITPAPSSFRQNNLHLHEKDVVIQNGGKRDRNLISTAGFKTYTELIEEPSTRTGYDASKSKKQFVIDKVINPLLKEGRHFYVKKGDRYELINLDDTNTKWEFAVRVTQKIRDCNKRLRTSNQREEENMPKAKTAKYTNDDSPKVNVIQAQSSTSNTNDRAVIEALMSLKVSK